MNTTMFYTKDMREAVQDTIAGRQKSRGEIAFAYHRQAKDTMWINKDEMTEQMKIWRKQKKAGDLHLNPKNNRTKVIGGKTWYIFVVQEGPDPEHIKPIGIDPIGFGFDEGMFLVDGMIYAFKDVRNRDMTYEYIMR
jgi:hypothetical protein